MNKKSIYNWILVTVVLLTISSCNLRSRELRSSLRQAGENRGELEQVLRHYSSDKADSLKYRAAVYLIENMKGHYSQGGERVESYFEYVDSIFSLDTLYFHARNILDDPSNRTLNKSDIEITYDLSTISADYLIANIDQAFDVLDYPWCKDLSFDNFCEYVLPYRVRKERYELWRPAVRAEYKTYVDSLAMVGASVKEVCSLLSTVKVRKVLESKHNVDYPPSLLMNAPYGTCIDQATWGIYLLRSIGIPVVLDYTIQWARRSGSHSWSSIVMPNESLVPFLINESDIPVGAHLDQKKHFAKVYRNCYTIQDNSLIMQYGDNEIPNVFKNPYQKDVTSKYVNNVMSIEVDLEHENVLGSKVIYLAVFDNQNWSPVGWGEIKRNKCLFNDIAPNVMYIAMYYEHNSFVPACYPFYVSQDGDVVKIIPQDDKPITVIADRKFHLDVVNTYYNNILNGKFQASNYADFRDAIDIYTIDVLPEMKWQEINIALNKPYRYYRYQGAEASMCNIAEIKFYNMEKDEILYNKIITMPEDEKYNLAINAFDNNELTYFRSSNLIDGWVGVELPYAQRVSQIKYLPRNDDNYIRAGLEYELFYWKDNNWASLGLAYGEHDGYPITFTNCPKGSLFLLKCNSRGKESRIFTYENDRQVWW